MLNPSSPKEYVSIQGISTDTRLGGGALFTCIERVSAGQFTIPAYVLSALPATGTMGSGASVMPSGYLKVATVSNFDAATFAYIQQLLRLVNYQ